MSSKIRVALAFAAAFVFISFVAPSANAASPEDACALLTAAQVSAGVSVSVKDGVPITPTDHKVCTWAATKPVPKSTKWVTLMLETVEAFQTGKASHLPGIVITPVSGVGDDAFYLAVGDNAGLIVKKGNVAFKVAVYADIPLADKEAMEKTLALQIVSKL
jgi:hypothetical protein